MKTNTRRVVIAQVTHEGGPAKRVNAAAQLRRSVCSALLWENEFYEEGEEIAARIAALVHSSKPAEVAALAIEAREKFHLRHMPLLLCRELALHPLICDYPKLASTTLARVIQRADELHEFLAIHWKGGKRPLTKQMKRGLAWAFHKFNEYQLAKYDPQPGPGVIRMRDVLFLVHALPRKRDGEFLVAPPINKSGYHRGETLRHQDGEGALWSKLVKDELAVPDTWEVNLSVGGTVEGMDQKEFKKLTFTRLIQEGKLGYLALLRNLRNMEQAGVDSDLINGAIRARKGAERVLPFRFLAAAKHAKQYEPALDQALMSQVMLGEQLPGRTLVLVDNSGSMHDALSAKSDMQRVDAAAGVAIIARGMCENVRIFSFANSITEVPPRQGMALRDAILATPSGGTYLGLAVSAMNALPHDRLIVITDEQSADQVPNPKQKGYMINVASAKNGVGYGPWVHIDGFSEAVMRFITETEKETRE